MIFKHWQNPLHNIHNNFTCGEWGRWRWWRPHSSWASQRASQRRFPTLARSPSPSFFSRHTWSSLELKEAEKWNGSKGQPTMYQNNRKYIWGVIQMLSSIYGMPIFSCFLPFQFVKLQALILFQTLNRKSFCVFLVNALVKDNGDWLSGSYLRWHRDNSSTC